MKPKSVFVNFDGLVLALVAVSRVQACTYYNSYTMDSCPARQPVSTTLVQNKATSQYTQLCCPAEPKSDITYFQENADACRQTKCVSKATAENTPDLCSTDAMETRVFIDGTEITMVESVRDECKGVGDNENEIGVIGLCCRKGSMDDYFTTLYGAETKEFPHFARVGNYGCGGTIYNEQWIITAAHCVVNEQHRVFDRNLDTQLDYENNVAQVRLNINVRDVKSEDTYNVTEIHVHPQSSFLKEGTEGQSYYDIALLKLDKKIKFGKNVKAVRIAEPGFDPLKYGEHVLVAGFGFTDTRRQSMKRQKANLLLHEKSKIYFLPEEHDQLLFAGGMLNGVVSPEVGKGDSGGPLLCRDKNGLATLCGVVSFIPFPTVACLDSLTEEECQTSVFVDVQFFNQWINEIAGGQENAQLEQEPLYGKEVGKTEYPGHVHITTNSGDHCGGTLVDEDVVLTASSCVVDENGKQHNKIDVVVGVTDLKDGSSAEKIPVKVVALLDGFEKVNRPQWGGGMRKKRVVSLILEKWQSGSLDKSKIMKDPYFKNNLALVKLAKKTGVMGVKVASQMAKTGDMAMEVAYPLKPSGTAANGRLPLQKRQFKILDQNDCQWRMDKLEPIGYNVKLDNNVVCGVEHFSGGSMCDRELGGGLYCKGEDGRNNVLCGVQISRLCEFNIPNEFIDVANMKYWIDGGLDSLKRM